MAGLASRPVTQRGKQHDQAITVLAAAVFAVRAEAGQISGQGKAIDSQIIKIGDTRVMLYGVDSATRRQTCELDGEPWQCWPAAVHELQTLLDQGPVVCDVVGEPDPNGRLLARCTVKATFHHRCDG